MNNREYDREPNRDYRRGEGTQHTDADDDVMLQQVRAALAPMPAVNRRAIADILAAVAQRKQTPYQRFKTRVVYALDQFRYATSPLTRATAAAALFVVVGYVSRGALAGDGPRGADTVPMVATATPDAASPIASPPDVPLQTVDDSADPSQRLVLVQFVLDAREVTDASTISVVGDFNNWDVTATPMTLTRGAWSAALPTTQGRHVYAFVVNGERWIADPRAPKASDTDFGRPGSIVLVQTP